MDVIIAFAYGGSIAKSEKGIAVGFEATRGWCFHGHVVYVVGAKLLVARSAAVVVGVLIEVFGAIGDFLIAEGDLRLWERIRVELERVRVLLMGHGLVVSVGGEMWREVARRRAGAAIFRCMGLVIDVNP